MDISRCLEKKYNSFRCTYCSYEYVLSLKEIIKTKRKQSFHKYDENISPFQEVCMMCCKGLMIPVKFTDALGKTILFHQIKPNVSLPDDETILARIILFQNEEI